MRSCNDSDVEEPRATPPPDAGVEPPDAKPHKPPGHSGPAGQESRGNDAGRLVQPLTDYVTHSLVALTMTVTLNEFAWRDADDMSNTMTLW